MRKLLVTCQCGQQMQVPRSAIGKMGMCPTCGQATRISTGNTKPLPNHGRGGASTQDAGGHRGGWAQQNYTEPPEEAKQRFGQAVDHYYAGRYAESLAVFDSLAREFPDNADIEHGRAQCLKAMKRPVLAAPEATQGPRVVQGHLDEETIRRVVLDKLLNGSTDEVQLRAAEIAVRYLKLDPPQTSRTVDAEAELIDRVDDTADSGGDAESSAGERSVGERNGKGAGEGRAARQPEVEIYSSKKEASNG